MIESQKRLPTAFFEDHGKQPRVYVCHQRNPIADERKLWYILSPVQMPSTWHPQNIQEDKGIAVLAPTSQIPEILISNAGRG